MYLISNDETYLKSVNERIHNYMKSNITNYNAECWSYIIKHLTEENFALNIGIDERDPLQALSKSEIQQLIETLPDGWIEKPNLEEADELVNGSNI